MPVSNPIQRVLPTDAQSVFRAALERGQLHDAVAHLVGQSRAWTLYARMAMDEIAALRDHRTEPLLGTLAAGIAEPAIPGSLLAIDRTATALLRRLDHDSASPLTQERDEYVAERQARSKELSHGDQSTD